MEITARPFAAEVSLAVDFFDPNLLNPAGVTDPYTGLISTDIGPVLKGEADGNGQAMDTMAIDEIRNLLFGNGGGGQDLIALDIQRGRDHGIENYNALRVSMGLNAVTSFAQITRNVAVQKELAQAYPGGVNTIDAFEGGLAEDHVAGSDVGPLFQSILVDQFTRLRDGDRFYFANEKLNADEMNLFSQVNTLTKVIEANTNVTNLQPDAFLFTTNISGLVTTAPNGPPPPPGAPAPQPVPLVGTIVSLLDSDGNVVATTTTSASGGYSFNQQAGLTTGSYTVSITLKNGNKLTTPTPIVISTGDQNITGVNFNVKPPPPVAPPVLPTVVESVRA